MDEEKPPFADKTIVGNYKPFMRYIALAKSKGIDVSNIVIREDLDELEKLLERGVNNLSDLIEYLSRKIVNRIDCELARDVYREVYGIDYIGVDACNMLAKLISGYVIELAKNLGIVKIKTPWRGG